MAEKRKGPAPKVGDTVLLASMRLTGTIHRLVNNGKTARVVGPTQVKNPDTGQMEDTTFDSSCGTAELEPNPDGNGWFLPGRVVTPPKEG